MIRLTAPFECVLREPRLVLAKIARVLGHIHASDPNLAESLADEAPDFLRNNTTCWAWAVEVLIDSMLKKTTCRNILVKSVSQWRSAAGMPAPVNLYDFRMYGEKYITMGVSCVEKAAHRLSN